ncbi:MAG: signal peptidase I [Acetivibrio sp.]
MYDKEKVEEAMELCRDIPIFYEKTTAHKEPSFSYMQASYKRNALSEKTEVSSQIEVSLQTIEMEPPRKSKYIKEITSFLLCILIAYGAARFITDFLVQPTRVDGASMENSLFDEDILLIDKISYRFREPKRYETVIFPYSMREYYVKRIVGLPGETVQIKEGSIYINDERLPEHYGSEEIIDAGIAESPLSLGADEYFLMGDNRNHSTDSRSFYVGPVKREKIEGKVWLRVYPFHRKASFQ